MSVQDHYASASRHRNAAAGNACPACGKAVTADAKWCASCGFTGALTMDLFPDPAPPLVPVFDAAAIWSASEILEIRIAREKLRKKFPQFRVNVWSVDLPSNISLPVFGFWLLNTCPFDTGESAENRAWTVLLLINAGTGHATVIPGYSAEQWLGDDDWKKILTSMGEKWRSRNPCASVIGFFESCADFLTISWNLRSRGRTRKTRS